jgi:hypothetical protein
MWIDEGWIRFVPSTKEVQRIQQECRILYEETKRLVGMIPACSGSGAKII